MTPRLFRLDVFGASDVGRVRDLNEDRFFADARTGVFAVADGMGGHHGGERASAAIVERLASVGVATTAPDLRARVEARLNAANAEIVALGEAAGATIGSTVVVLLLFGDRFACLWAGDSRLYRFSRGILWQVSRDHSKVQELLDAGLITAGEAANWPERNVITRAVGVFSELELSRMSDAVRAGDVFLLCSDGLTGHVGDDEIATWLARADAKGAAEGLIAAALQRGGSDNVTALVLRCLESTASPGAGNV
ncbi:protein phosphatase 2C domain-containing protein [Aurantimonas sp. 22II-16-19i]|uniref:PP2C family protein-serine/threonine phosphatase n=1 Tax=Aurantimonas sp. 22II-16-19i TaxID=1317114 RepID=UPI0009F7F3AC|nr:protein phosphatase 2C domain-containing protein [Aurantimonas sp. 22II-16-19i]ORE97225.1 protein serine/threonine phosphatase [Aurantimonas sp. 22II-16-19i]